MANLAIGSDAGNGADKALLNVNDQKQAGVDGAVKVNHRRSMSIFCVRQGKRWGAADCRALPLIVAGFFIAIMAAMLEYESPYGSPQVAAIIHAALHEDLQYVGDLTCQCLVDPGANLRGQIIAKAAGVVCGVPLFAAVVQHLNGAVEVAEVVDDGQWVEPGAHIVEFRGSAAAILMAERSALNLMQSLSGVATATRAYADLVAGTRCRIFDTRKTAPGQRLLQKHAVYCGGGANHRIGLFDQVLIKENHIALMRSDGPSGPEQAVRRCRERLGLRAVIEVEIQSIDQLEGVIAGGADIVLCDNMGPDLLAQAVRIRDDLGCAPHDPQTGIRIVALEASGGITKETLRAVAETGVERVSIGALTHSVTALDLSLLCECE